MTSGNRLLVVRWTAPADNGGSPIQRYEIEIVNGTHRTTRTTAATASQLTVTGLTNGVAYRVRIRAVNGIGAGTQSALSGSVTPKSVPSTVASLTSQAGSHGGKATSTLRWTPGSGNGASVTKYRVTIQRLNSRGAATGNPTVVVLPARTRSMTFTGAGSGVRYRYTVQQINAVGTGSGRTTFGFVR